MRRWLIYAAVLAILGSAPFPGMDISRLLPVRTVWLTEQNGQIYMQTDDGNFGTGRDIEEALCDLNKSATGVVFLETADYLIVEEGGEVLLEQALAVFRPTCMVCTAEKMPDLGRATEYLRAHEPEITLQQWRVESKKLPQLHEKDGRFCWRDG